MSKSDGPTKSLINFERWGSQKETKSHKMKEGIVSFPFKVEEIHVLSFLIQSLKSLMHITNLLTSHAHQIN